MLIFFSVLGLLSATALFLVAHHLNHVECECLEESDFPYEDSPY